LGASGCPALRHATRSERAPVATFQQTFGTFWAIAWDDTKNAGIDERISEAKLLVFFVIESPNVSEASTRLMDTKT
jgi:hypothetical protein